MTIGVDAGPLAVRDDRLKAGVYRVTKNALLALSIIDKKNYYRLYSFNAIEEGIIDRFEGRAEIVVLKRHGWQRVWLPIELKKHPVDAFLGFAQALFSHSTLYDVGFIYDLGFLYKPEAYGASARKLKKQTDRLVRRADHIITISHATKSDIVHEYVLPNESVTAAYPGIDSSFSAIGEKYSTERPYVLFVGSLTKTKDIPMLLEMVARTPFDFYLIGGDYWPDPAIDVTIEALHLGDRVKKLGVVPDRELPRYYRGAAAFVTAALREGFCLPAAEAMACGTPVVALDRGALKEIVGEGGTVVREKYQFVEAMEKMTNKKIRATCAKKALMQAKKFRWERFAQHILDSIHQ